MGVKRTVAFAAIYLLWGGSYLAIRGVVEVIPPFFAAGVRYTLGGLILASFCVCFGSQPLPNRRQTLNAVASGIALLAFGYGVVFWAETRLTSWVVAVLVSTLFLWTYLGECIVLRLNRLRGKILLPLLLGLCGMPLLLRATLKHGQAKSLVAAIAVLAGACLFATTTLAIKRIEMPRSHVQTAALQLVSSGITLLFVSSLLGELSRLPAARLMFSPRPAFGMAYLVVASSVIAFTAFHWLLMHESASLVATAAYVNPMVAMLLGLLVVHERWSRLQLLGAAVVLVSIVVVWRAQRPVRAKAAGREDQRVRANRGLAAALRRVAGIIHSWRPESPAFPPQSEGPLSPR
jgi:drug/metabolite transporter (DMT)-like permease